MFHWICPECGQEIAPGVKECPACEPQASAFSLPSGGPPITAPLESEVASAALLVAPVVAPAEHAVAASVTAKPSVEPAAPQPEAVLQPEVILRPEEVLQAKVLDGPESPMILPLGLEAIPAEARPVMIPDVSAGPSPIQLPDRLSEPASNGGRQPETFADRLADLADHLHGEHIPFTAPRLFQESAAPGPRVETPGKTPIILDVTFSGDVTCDENTPLKGMPTRTLLAAPPSRLLLAEPQPPSVAQEIPMEAFEPPPSAYAVLRQEPIGAEPTVASVVQLPQPPNRTPAPALAALQDYSASADRLMRAVDIAAQPVSSKGLASVTLPGPALPRELQSLQAAGLVPIRTRGMRPGASSGYGWVSKYVLVGMLLTAGVATYSMMPGPATSASPRPTPEPAPDPPVTAEVARSTNSLARLVEVTGVRFMEVNKKPQIHYLVVNHSSAPLASMTVYVTLRAATAKSGQPPIAKLTFRSPALAAFEAKEMFSSIERATGAVDLPDWQDLRADVDVQ